MSSLFSAELEDSSYIGAIGCSQNDNLTPLELYGTLFSG